MVALTLPDGRVRRYERAPSGADVASDIGSGLAETALAVRVNGALWDLSRTLEEDAEISIVTRRDDDELALDLLRHDAAHVLAEAAKELYPDIQVTIGPAIADGFYYDFSREEPFTPEDLEAMEARMHEIVDRDEEVVREMWERDAAIALFKDMGEHYKAEIVSGIPDGEPITLYRQGRFVDLCRGPHLPSTGRLGHAFKLTKLAGAYWRGDSRKEMLQRVYGTAWRDDKELEAYLRRLEEAERRDHRRLGRDLDLFHFQEEAAGMAFWHPKGWTLYRVVEAYMRRRLEAAGYVEVRTPQLVDRMLWEASGHWEKFRENMYISESEERVFALKPMNCPCHVQIFNQRVRSYRELPLRMAEFGSCHRYEPSGSLHGLMRVRGFVQDDAHIFCAEDQINSETRRFCDLLTGIYRDFGFEEVQARFSDRPEVRAGSDETWDKAEGALRSAVEEAGIQYTLNPGDGAFYGPKLDFELTDAIGRQWQCGTLQVDFVLPERLDAEYAGEDGGRYRPVMLHRAILGSFERFIGILVEHYAGGFPMWLAPVQAVVTTIVRDGDEFAGKVAERLRSAGLRVLLDVSADKINYKVRRHSHAKVPAIVVIGKREAENGSVSIRRLGSREQQNLALDEAVVRLGEEARAPGA